MRSLYPPVLSGTDHTQVAIGTIYCIGRNYREHAREMGSELPSSPIVFLKPASAFVPSGGTVSLPNFSSLVHYEVELVIVIGKTLLDCDAKDAPSAISAVAVGVDLTLRDIQSQAKAAGEPWAVAKGFLGSAPISPLVPFEEIQSLDSLKFTLKVNGQLRQSGQASDMERSVPELISYLSNVFGLRAGDCIFTGTPSGVGPIKRGDSLEAELVGYTKLAVTIE